MTTIPYRVNDRDYTTFEPIEHELQLNSNQNYLFDLSYLSVLNILGQQAHAFLQGQMSCNIEHVTPHEMRQGALCNLKGRVLALLDVVHWQDTTHLIVPMDLLSQTQISLEKASKLSKVEVIPAQDYQMLGFLLQDPQDLTPFKVSLPQTPYSTIHGQSYYCYHLGQGYYVCLVEKTRASTLISEFIEHSQWRGSATWHALRLRQKHIEIYPLSRGLFLPHRLDLHQSEYLSFNKGCYKGQEIIARMHYRSKPKHELSLFTINTQQRLQSGMRMLTTSGTEVGELVDFSPINETTYLLAASVIFDCPESCIVADHTEYAWRL